MSGPNSQYDPKEVAALSDDELSSAVQAALGAFSAASDLDALAAAHAAHLGPRSDVALARRELGALPPQARADAGRRVNEALAAITAAYDERHDLLERDRDERVLIEEAVDVTLPSERRFRGGRHPLTVIQERVADVFVAMGWEIAEGPEVEAAWYNFDALNIPPAHPARETQDTLWIDPPEAGVLLRTQTSPVQIRALLARGAPCYVAVPGRVYRQEALDATHSAVFHQLEGLAVDEGLTMGDLRGTLDALARAMFGAQARTRLRPDHYPFTEPSADVDLQCWVCHGTSTEPGAARCHTCRSEGWVEWGGSGMVHPSVLASAGVDPKRFTGFAFGMGLERTLMSRHDMKDIRDLVEGDVRVTAALGRES
ncbi:MAG TPA: phenylalanine--tRNA ligase subunit alpha [Mycobacteriales bacterium]|nr:phenylalanine--tRNA ligase subunit alpha [Mycobacteriales bacterium]